MQQTICIEKVAMRRVQSFMVQNNTEFGKEDKILEHFDQNSKE